MFPQPHFPAKLSACHASHCSSSAPVRYQLRISLRQKKPSAKLLRTEPRLSARRNSSRQNISHDALPEVSFCNTRKEGICSWRKYIAPLHYMQHTSCHIRLWISETLPCSLHTTYFGYLQSSHSHVVFELYEGPFRSAATICSWQASCYMYNISIHLQAIARGAPYRLHWDSGSFRSHSRARRH